MKKLHQDSSQTQLISLFTQTVLLFRVGVRSTKFYRNYFRPHWIDFVFTAVSCHLADIHRIYLAVWGGRVADPHLLHSVSFDEC